MFKQATVNSSRVAATLSDYPSYIDISRAGVTTLAEAQSSRVYADENKVVEWAREVVSAEELHTKVPSMTTTTSVFVDADGVRADYATDATYGAEAVWGDYYAVYHLNDLTTSTVLDSVGDNNGTKRSSNNPPEISGKIGNAQDFVNANSDYIDADGVSSLISNNDYTVSAWYKTEEIINGDRQRMVVAGSKTTYADMGLDVYIDRGSDTDGNVRCQFRLGATGAANIMGEPATPGVWEMFHLTRTGTTAVLFQQGESVGSITNSEVGAPAGAGFRIGGLPQGVNFMGGGIDEVRVKKTVSSANRITTEYNNQNDEADFWGSWTDVGVTVRRNTLFAFAGL